MNLRSHERNCTFSYHLMISLVRKILFSQKSEDDLLWIFDDLFDELFLIILFN